MALQRPLVLWTVLILLCSTIICKCNGKYDLKIPAILVFGDSGFDTGNNNYINALVKSNFRPYGIDFPGRIPTGRFSDGKLVPDMLASTLGIKETVPPFLQPNLSDQDMLTGVCFASAGAGLDDQTTALANAIPVSKQLEYFKDYIKRLEGIAADQEAQRIIGEALVIINIGINDLVLSFDLPSTRQLEFTISEYQDFLLKNLQKLLKELYDLGSRKLVVTGIPPIGCMPLALTAYSPLESKCVEKINTQVQDYNEKLSKLLLQMEAELPGTKIPFADVYSPLINLINNPQKYGFMETRRGCCGSGFIEIAQLCNPLIPVCKNPSEYVFWDGGHLTESTYRYIFERLIKELLPVFSKDA